STWGDGPPVPTAPTPAERTTTAPATSAATRPRATRSGAVRRRGCAVGGRGAVALAMGPPGPVGSVGCRRDRRVRTGPRHGRTRPARSLYHGRHMRCNEKLREVQG